MFKEIRLDGKGWARGRNGYFVPRRVELFEDVRGRINMEVWSRRLGKIEPIFLRFSTANAMELGQALTRLGSRGFEAERGTA